MSAGSRSSATHLALLTSAAVLGWTAAASADALGYHRHDGFYLRLGLGGSSLHLQRSGKIEAPNVAVFEGDSSISGGAVMGEISVGGTPASGFVLAATSISYLLPGATLVTDQGEIDLENDLSAGMLGITADWFVFPTRGFHFGGTLGLAGAGVRLPEPVAGFEGLGGAGLGLSLGVGYDWWIAEEWSLGVLGRATFMGLRGEDTHSGITGSEEDTLQAYGIMFTALYH